MQKLFLSVAVMALAAGSVSAAPSAVDAQRILRDTKVLSSDAYEGRAPATEGEKKTVAYLVEQMKAAGLQPAGDPLPGGGRGWTASPPRGPSAWA